MPEPRPAARLARGLGGIGLSGVTVAGAAAAGVLTSMRTAYPRPPNLAPAEGRPAASAVPDDRLVVAVVLGASGSVVTDARGQRHVQDDKVTTTAGVTSGCSAPCGWSNSSPAAPRRNGSAATSPIRAGSSTAPPESPSSAGGHAISPTCWPWPSHGGGQPSASD
jgi:hypothetical protein